MKKHLFYLLLFAAMVITSCKKSDISIDLNWGGFSGINLSFNQSILDSNAMNIIKLPAGRYFIYKDEASGQTDSVIVTQSIDSFALQNSGPGYPVTYFYSIFKLTLTNFSGSTAQTWFSANATSDFPANSGSTPITVTDSNFIFSNEQINLPAFWYPLQSSGVLQYTLLPSSMVEGNNYTEVHKFSAGNGYPPSDANYLATEFYWAKGIGIIKRVITTGTALKTSLLLRYGKI